MPLEGASVAAKSRVELGWAGLGPNEEGEEAVVPGERSLTRAKVSVVQV
jgi:hypothetical protein